MKVTINTSRMKKVLKFIAPLLSGNKILPITSFIKLETIDGKLRINATDLNVGITIDVDCEIHKEGICFAEGNAFVKLVNSINDENILLSEKSNGVHVNTVSGKYTLAAVSSEDIMMFPVVDLENLTEIFDADFQTVCKPLKTAISFVAKDELRPALCCINVRSVDGLMVIEATDAHRLFKNTTQISCNNNALLPSIFTKYVTNIPVSGNTNIKVYKKSESTIVAVVGNTTITAKLTEGKFPNIDPVIPKSCESSISCSKHDLISSINRCLILTNTQTNCVLMNLNTPLTIKSLDMTLNKEASETLLHSGNIKMQMEIGFNGLFLQEILNSLTYDYVNINFISPEKPIVIYNEDDDNKIDDTTLFLLMPLKV